ncbi:MAG: hypothetical protein WCC17_17055 [Candidatus Nitrosopolaris sp.]
MRYKSSHSGKKKETKIISLEEHFRNAAIEDAVKKALPPSQRDLFVASKSLSGLGSD